MEPRALDAEFALTIEKPAEAEQPPAPALAKSGSRKLLVRRKKPSPESAPAPYIEPPSPGQQALLARRIKPGETIELQTGRRASLRDDAPPDLSPESVAAAKGALRGPKYDAYARRPAQPLAGPQATLDATSVVLQSSPGVIADRVVRLTNTGSANLFFEWRRVAVDAGVGSSAAAATPSVFFLSQRSGVALPGQTVPFTFSFASPRPAIHTDGWELHVTPPLPTPPPRLSLRGVCVETDERSLQRQTLAAALARRQVREAVRDIVARDVVDAVVAAIAAGGEVATSVPGASDVRAVQTALAALGFYGGAASGDVDGATAAAVSAFQAASQLDVTATPAARSCSRGSRPAPTACSR